MRIVSKFGVEADVPDEVAEVLLGIGWSKPRGKSGPKPRTSGDE